MSGTTRVYVGRLPSGVRDSDVEKFFKGFGRIREITLKEGYGFIEFNDRRDAEDAVYELNGKELCGDRIIVEHAKPPGERRERGGGSRGRGGFGDRDRYSGGRDSRDGGSRGGGYRSNSGPAGGFDRFRNNTRNPAPPRTGHRVVVENLSSRVSWQDLKDYMRKAGEVIYADAHKLRPNEGIVEFASADDMKKAISTLDDSELSGRRIKLTEEKRQGGGGGGGGGGARGRRSRSRSDSRSRSRSRSRTPLSRSRTRSKTRSRTPASSRSKSRDRE